MIMTEYQVGRIAAELVNGRVNSDKFLSYHAAIKIVKIAHGMIPDERDREINYHPPKATNTIKQPYDARLNMRVEDMSLSNRSKNCLRLGKIKTVGDLVKISEDDLFKIKGMGETSVDDIKECLGDMGLSLRA